MPPRVRLPSTQWQRSCRMRIESFNVDRGYASLASNDLSQPFSDTMPQPVIHRHDPSQPPSHRRPEARKTQLLRQYISLLRSCPIVLLFQHNSLLATELTALRTLITRSMHMVDETHDANCAAHIKFQIMQTGLLNTALRLAEFWHPPQQTSKTTMSYTHSLSEEAFQSVTENEQRHGLEPLLTGPIAILAFPTMSTQHLKIALSLLSPSTEFPAPKRRAMPTYHASEVQSAISKLLLLGARIEDQAMDLSRLKWVGGISGGIDGLRGNLLAALESSSSRLVQALSTASTGLSQTLESRQSMLQAETKS